MSGDAIKYPMAEHDVIVMRPFRAHQQFTQEEENFSAGEQLHKKGESGTDVLFTRLGQGTPYHVSREIFTYRARAHERLPPGPSQARLANRSQGAHRCSASGLTRAASTTPAPSLAEESGRVWEPYRTLAFLPPPSKYCSISSSVLPLVSGRKKAAVTK